MRWLSCVIAFASSAQMQKTIVVAVNRYRVHKLYGKRQLYTTKLMAHDEDEVCKMGDKVRVEFCRPLSKRKVRGNFK